MPVFVAHRTAQILYIPFFFLMRKENTQQNMEQSSHSAVRTWKCVDMTSIEVICSGITLSFVNMRIHTQ